MKRRLLEGVGSDWPREVILGIRERERAGECSVESTCGLWWVLVFSVLIIYLLGFVSETLGDQFRLLAPRGELKRIWFQLGWLQGGHRQS